MLEEAATFCYLPLTMTQKRIRLAVIGLVVLAAILGAGGWFWSLGAIASEDIQKARVELVKEPVEWRRQNEADWKPLSGAIELLPGDHLRTGEGGEAVIRWGDAGITRLESGAELEIEQIGVGTEEPLIIRMRLEGGRVWSRVLKVLDVEGGISVETSDVVATVRGTSFGVGKSDQGTEAAVTESVIGIRNRFLKEGQWGLFNATGTVVVRDLTPSDEWAVRNRAADIEFERAFLRELEERFAHRAQDRAGVPTWLLEISERLRLSFLQGDKAEDLAARYALRHAARGDDQAVLAFGERAGSRAILVARELHALAALEAFRRYGEGESAASDQRIASLRDLRDLLLLQMSDGAFIAKAVALNESIDERVFGPAPSDLESVDRVLLSELAGLSGELPADARRSELSSRLDAMGYRLGFEGNIEPVSEELPIDEELPPTLQPGVRTDAPELQPDVIMPAETGRTYERLVLYATPMQATVGSPVTVQLYGIRADGLGENLTSQASFSAEGQGSFLGNVFTPTAAGTAVLYGTYRDAQGARTASVQISVTTPPPAVKSLQSIRFAFQSDTTMSCSSKLPFKVWATYSDGSTRDVTISIQASVSNDQLISVQGDAVVSYCAGQTTSAQVYASYTEAGRTVQTSATITVVPDPQSGGGGGQTPGRYPLY